MLSSPYGKCASAVACSETSIYVAINIFVKSQTVIKLHEFKGNYCKPIVEVFYDDCIVYEQLKFRFSDCWYSDNHNLKLPLLLISEDIKSL